MYRQVESSPISPENFGFPLSGKLSGDNRWVIMEKLIPWAEFEEEYAQHFSEDMGAPAKTFRLALGSLIIKEKLGTSDRETVEQIRENPYLQYFLGLKAYTNEAPFDDSMFVHFRQKIGVDLVNKLNRQMVRKNREDNSVQPEEKNPELEDISESKNQGKLILDATVAPGDITYPNDLGILNQARKQTERIIDSLYEPLKGKLQLKPRTYRKLARKDYLLVAKCRKPLRKKRRKAIRKQLQYIQRNLSHIEQLIKKGAPLKSLRKRQYKMLLVVTEIYRQQLWMYENNKQSINDRIVSLTQPHLRPIVRGKAGKSVEFGAKISASCLDKYIFLDRISWDNFNESGDFKTQVEKFKEFTGYYPESVHVDKIYRTRENRAWCKEKGIRISGPPLGRPPANISEETKKQAKEDEKIRNLIEGKFGEAKRRYSLARVMAKLPQTSETAIAVTFLVMNLSSLLRQIFCLFYPYFKKQEFSSITNRKKLYLGLSEIIKTYPFYLLKKTIALC